MSYATRRLTRKRNKELTATKKALECANADLTARDNTIANLRDDAKERAAELSRAKATIEDQACSIAAFKEEHLALMLEVAEMRGYINRTLEDDHVREFGPAKMAEPAMHPAERDSIIHALQDDDRKRRQPPRPMRQGPGPMRPMVMVHPDTFDIDHHFGAGRAMTTAPKPPKHWTAR